ncbi:MAG: malonyl CoA-acyl carrier protein transacylase [Rhodothermales bacterium]|jgi:malonyl CoA-acyl carrier protein transacylase
MTRIFLFPGQGAQTVGMGADLFDRFADRTAEADAVLGYSIKALCLEDANEKLGQTQFTQPALYTVNALAYEAAIADGDAPDVVAGHSLGEYNALHAAGVFDFATGLRLVQRRGAIMSQASGGGMAAVLKLSEADVRAVIADSGLDSIDIANLNSPGQTVISGPAADIAAAQGAFEEAGARYIPLAVSGAFHSRYMQSAQDEFDAFLAEFALAAPQIPVIANVTAAPYEADAVQSTLSSQIANSVRWTESMGWCLSQGEPEFTELGPGRVLSGLLRQIQRANR